MAVLLCFTFAGFAKHKEDKNVPAVAGKPADSTDAGASKKGPKPFDKVITSKAVSKKGLFTVHKIEEKWYFEIPDSLFNREIIVTTRYSKTAAGGGGTVRALRQLHALSVSGYCFERKEGSNL